MAGFSLFVDATGSPFDKIAQKGRNVTLSMLFRTLWHVVYATLGLNVQIVEEHLRVICHRTDLT